jgi:hypothetical protein
MRQTDPIQRKAALEAARKRVDELIKEEPERIRLAKLKRARQAALSRNGMAK